MGIDIKSFTERQLREWPLLADNTAALRKAKTRSVRGIDGLTVQHNPERIRSTGAKVDAATVAQRPCFLCDANRPAEQEALPWRGYKILPNPYPIFPGHLTIVAAEHIPQLLAPRTADMTALADELDGYAVFYNGAACGASAPDHAHFQAVKKQHLPILSLVPRCDAGAIETFCCLGGVRGFAIGYDDPAEGAALLGKVLAALPVPVGEDEPRVNVICTRGLILVIPRKAHRPACYGEEEGRLLVSPASVDLAGCLITPRATDFKALSAKKVKEILGEVCMSRTEIDNTYAHINGCVNVGILTSETVEMTLHGNYFCDGDVVSGAVHVSARHCPGALSFVPLGDDAYAEVKGVTIGVSFHWQRELTLRYRGVMRIVNSDGRLVLINSIDIERYLESVISSEMSGTSSPELLKAHAVISRSWLLAQIRSTRSGNACTERTDNTSLVPKRIVWYDHDSHSLYDVCADDHCQRYQGVSAETPPQVAEAVSATSGQVLTYGGKLCDARFSKCCGGVFEEFQNCWDDTPAPYLKAARDSDDERDFPDLSVEENARRWIMSAPKAYCNTTDRRILQQVLKEYDRETADFFRWSVERSSDELGRIIASKSGIDFGRIVDLVPLRRGTSGRITLLRIVGEKRTIDIGKELEIRRWLSPTHLYSSAFVVEHTETGFRLHGAGWGHGVGLCQIGAAVMAANDADYRSILKHYYPGTEIVNSE